MADLRAIVNEKLANNRSHPAETLSAGERLRAAHCHFTTSATR
ncbi:MAG TPA: hypothetical protein VMA35_10510 [Candidatus Sulfopaludibacter sp.]|nr:hypothetical protein [Candidatus Sulfopaludibacter sp.]